MPNSPSIVYFDATLKPNTALSPRAFLIIMALVGGMSFLAGLMFLSMGAFPVLGWFGLDALAIWYAFRRNFRNLKEETTVQVTADAIRLLPAFPRQRLSTLADSFLIQRYEENPELLASEN